MVIRKLSKLCSLMTFFQFRLFDSSIFLQNNEKFFNFITNFPFHSLNVQNLSRWLHI